MSYISKLLAFNLYILVPFQRKEGDEGICPRCQLTEPKRLTARPLGVGQTPHSLCHHHAGLLPDLRAHRALFSPRHLNTLFSLPGILLLANILFIFKYQFKPFLSKSFLMPLTKRTSVNYSLAVTCFLLGTFRSYNNIFV